MSSSPQGNPFADWLKQQNPDYHREIEGDFDVDAAMNAIQSHEADTPLTRNRDSGATGYYQIMPDNIKAWSKEILGREYSVEEFQNDPAAQDRVAREKIKQYAKARGGDVREVLKDWYGRGNPGEGYPSPDAYAERGLKTYNEGIDKMDAYEQKMLAQFKASQGGATSQPMTEEDLQKVYEQQRAMGGNPDANQPAAAEAETPGTGAHPNKFGEALSLTADALGIAKSPEGQPPTKAEERAGQSVTGHFADPFGFERNINGDLVPKRGLVQRTHLASDYISLDEAKKRSEAAVRSQVGIMTDDEWNYMKGQFPQIGRITKPGDPSHDYTEEEWKAFQDSARDYNKAIIDWGKQKLHTSVDPAPDDKAGWDQVIQAGKERTGKDLIGMADIGIPQENIDIIRRGLEHFRSEKLDRAKFDSQKAMEKEQNDLLPQIKEAEAKGDFATARRLIDQMNYAVTSHEHEKNGLETTALLDSQWSAYAQQYRLDPSDTKAREKWLTDTHRNFASMFQTLLEQYQHADPTVQSNVDLLTGGLSAGTHIFGTSGGVGERRAGEITGDMLDSLTQGIFTKPGQYYNPITRQTEETNWGIFGSTPGNARDVHLDQERQRLKDKGGLLGDVYSAEDTVLPAAENLIAMFAGLEGTIGGTTKAAGFTGEVAKAVGEARLMPPGVGKALIAYSNGLEKFGTVIKNSPRIHALVESAGLGYGTTAARNMIGVMDGSKTMGEALDDTIKTGTLDSALFLTLMGPAKAIGALSEKFVVKGETLNKLKELFKGTEKDILDEVNRVRAPFQVGDSPEYITGMPKGLASEEVAGFRSKFSKGQQQLADLLGTLTPRTALTGLAGGLAAGQSGIRTVLTNEKPDAESVITDLAFNLMGLRGNALGAADINEGLQRGAENNPLFGPTLYDGGDFGFGLKSQGESAGKKAADTRAQMVEWMTEHGPEEVRQSFVRGVDKANRLLDVFDLRKDISPDQVRNRVKEINPELTDEQIDATTKTLLDPKTKREDIEAGIEAAKERVKAAEEAVRAPDVMDARATRLREIAADNDSAVKQRVKETLENGEADARRIEEQVAEPQQNIQKLGTLLQANDADLEKLEAQRQELMGHAKHAADISRDSDETIKFLLAKQQRAIHDVNTKYVNDIIDGVPADGREMPPAVKERLDQMTAGLNQATLESAEAKKMADDANNAVDDHVKNRMEPLQKRSEDIQKQIEEQQKAIEDITDQAQKTREKYQKEAERIQKEGDSATEKLKAEAQTQFEGASKRREEIKKEQEKAKEEKLKAKPGGVVLEKNERKQAKIDRKKAKVESKKKAQDEKRQKATSEQEPGKADVNTKDGSKTDEKKGEPAKPATVKAGGESGEKATETTAEPVSAENKEAKLDAETHTEVVKGRAGVKANILAKLHEWNNAPDTNMASLDEEGATGKGTKKTVHTEKELDAFAESMTNMVDGVRKSRLGIDDFEDVGRLMFGAGGFRDFMKWGGQKWVPMTEDGVALPGTGNGFTSATKAKEAMDKYLAEHPDVDPDSVRTQQPRGYNSWDQNNIHLFRTGTLSTVTHEFGHRIRPLLRGEDQALLDRAFNGGKKDWDIAAEERFTAALEYYNWTAEPPPGIDAKTADLINTIRGVMRTIWNEMPDRMLNVEMRGDISPDVAAFFGELNHGIPRATVGAERVRQILVAGGTPIIVGVPPTTVRPDIRLVAGLDNEFHDVNDATLGLAFDPNSKFSMLINELPGLVDNLRGISQRSLGAGRIKGAVFKGLELDAKGALKAKWRDAYSALLDQNPNLDPDSAKRVLYAGLATVLRTPDMLQVEKVLQGLEEAGYFRFATGATALQIGLKIAKINAFADALERELIKRGMNPDVHLGGSNVRKIKQVAFSPEDAVKNPKFRAWFRGSKIVGKDGLPVRLYHGTTHDFDAFDTRRADPEGAFGGGIYLTTSTQDVSDNYAGIGPDLRGKIERTAERMVDDYYGGAREDFLYDHGLSDDFDIKNVEDLAKKQLHGGAEGVLPVYAVVKNPAILDKGSSFGGQSYFDPIEKYLPKTDEYVEDPKSNGHKFIVALRGELGAQEFISDRERESLINSVLDDLFAEEPIGRIYNNYRDHDAYSSINNEEGSLEGLELFRRALAAAGFDGAVMNASLRFPGMVKGDVEHVIVFHENQVKSAIGNSGKYSRTDNRIQYSPEDRKPFYSHKTEDGKAVELSDESQAELAKTVRAQGKNRMTSLSAEDRIVPYGYNPEKAENLEGVNQKALDRKVSELARKQPAFSPEDDKAGPEHWMITHARDRRIERGMAVHGKTFDVLIKTKDPKHFAFIGPDGTGYAKTPGDLTHRETWSKASGYKYDNKSFSAQMAADAAMMDFLEATNTLRVADMTRSGVYIETRTDLTPEQRGVLADKYYGLPISFETTKGNHKTFARVNVLEANEENLSLANKYLAKGAAMKETPGIADRTVIKDGKVLPKDSVLYSPDDKQRRQKPSDEEIARLRQAKLDARREYVDSRPDMNPEEARTGFYSEVERAIPKVFGNKTEMSAKDVREGIVNSGAKKEELRDLGLDTLFKERGDKPVTRAEVETLMKANRLEVVDDRLGGGPGKNTPERLAYQAKLTEAQGFESDAKVPALRVVLKAYDFGNNATAEHAGRASSILKSLVDGESNTEVERKLLESPEVKAYQEARKRRKEAEEKYRLSDPAYALQKAQEALANFNETHGRIGYFDQAAKAVREAIPSLDPSDVSWYLSLIKAGTDISGSDYTSGDRKTAKEIMELPAVKKYLQIEAEKAALAKAYNEAHAKVGRTTKPTHYSHWTRGALPFDPDTYTELLFKLPTSQPQPQDIKYRKDKDGGIWVDLPQVMGRGRVGNHVKIFPTAEGWRVQGIEFEGGSEITASSLERAKTLTEDELLREARRYDRTDAKFTSGHFGGQDNLLAHGRFAVTELNGKKYLQAMEVQSDWHQAARDLRSDEVDRIMREAKESGKPITKGEAEKMVPQDFGWESAKETHRHQDVILSDMIARSKEILKDQGFDSNEVYERVASSNEKNRINGILDEDPKLAELQKELDTATRERRINRVADAPLKDVWHEYVLKAMIREAAARGLDGIILNGGKVNDERYHFSDMGVSRIDYDHKTMELTAYDRDGDPHQNVDHIIVRPENLHQYIGRGVAERLLKTDYLEGDYNSHSVRADYGDRSPGSRRSWVVTDGRNGTGNIISSHETKREAQDALTEIVGIHSLGGDDLKIKTPGMYTTYDEKYPNFLNKHIARLGWDKMGVKGVERYEKSNSSLAGRAEPDIHWKLDFPEQVVEGIKTKGQPLYAPEDTFGQSQNPTDRFAEMSDEDLISKYKQAVFEAESITKDTVKDWDNMNKESLAEIISNFGKANLLSAFGVHFTNITSNTLYAASKVASEPVAAMVDLITSSGFRDPETGMRMRTFVASPRADLAAFLQTLSFKGFDATKTGDELEREILKQGGMNKFFKELLPQVFGEQPDSMREKMEGLTSRHVVHDDNPILSAMQHYSEAMFRILGAEDAIANTFYVARSLRNQAIAMEKSGMGTYEELMANPTRSMINIAEFEGLQSTFNHRNWTSTQWARLKNGLLEYNKEQKAAFKGTDSKAGKAASGTRLFFGEGAYLFADQMAPFVQTPTNILMRGFDMTPIGIVRGALKIADAKAAVNEGAMKTVLGKEAVFNLKRQGVQLVGEGSTPLIGLGIMYAMGLGVKKILIPYISEQEKEAARFSAIGGEGYEGGKLILFGRTWDAIALGPPGLLLLAAAAFGKHVDEGYAEGIMASGKSLINAMAHHPLLENVHDAVEWGMSEYEYLGDKENKKEKPNMFAAGMVKKMVPLSGLAGNVAMMSDEYKRDQKTWQDVVQAAIPGHGTASLGLPKGSLGAASKYIDVPGREDLPVKMSEVTGEPLKNTRIPLFSSEKYTLDDPGNEVLKTVVTNRISPPMVSQKKTETEEQNKARKATTLRLWNKAMQMAISSDKYKSLPDWTPSMGKRELGELDKPENKREYVMWYMKKVVNFQKTMSEMGLN